MDDLTASLRELLRKYEGLSNTRETRAAITSDVEGFLRRHLNRRHRVWFALRDLKNIEVHTSRYEHPHECCTFLGCHLEYDLYHCSLHGDTVRRGNGLHDVDDRDMRPRVILAARRHL